MSMDISISTNLIAISSLQNLKFKTFLFTFLPKLLADFFKFYVLVVYFCNHTIVFQTLRKFRFAGWAE